MAAAPTIPTAPAAPREQPGLRNGCTDSQTGEPMVAVDGATTSPPGAGAGPATGGATGGAAGRPTGPGAGATPPLGTSAGGRPPTAPNGSS